MIACSRSLLRVDSVLKFVNCYVISKPVDCFQGRCSYHGLTFNRGIGGIKNIFSVHAMGRNRKQKAVAHIWRPVSTQATSEDGTIESEDGGKVQVVHCSTSGSVSNAQEVLKVSEVVTEIADSTVSVTVLEDKVKDEALELQPDLSPEKHSRCLKVGSSLFRFIVGKGGTTRKEIEEKMRVKITIPSSKMEEDVVIEGASIDSVTRASEKIQAILDEAVKSPNLEYSHFISLPLAIYPELVDKLVNFQNSILGSSDASLEEVLESGSGEDTSDKKDKDRNKVDLTSIPLISYAPKKSKSPTLSDLGIDKSIFIKPKTFHLTVLMLKLWNKERVNAASEVLKSISSKVMEALDNRPVSVRLKGLDCMRGSLAKARVLYATVEEIGSEGRLSRACQVITDAFVEAGLVLEKDAKQKLKLHATVMNAKHRKGKKRRRNDSFDARGIFEKYGSEEWGDYLIREAHLSQRFVYDENGYYHCCASIPFPESMQID